MTRTIELSALALSVVLALGAVVGTASARDDQRDYRGNEHREYHRGNEGWNNGYRAPPVVYGGQGYYPPPVVYGSGLGININVP